MDTQDDKEPAKWTVTTKVGSLGKVIAELRANGRVVHEVSGHTGYESLTAYADEQNKRGAPEPPKKVKTGADGYSFKTPPVKGKPTPVMECMREWAKKHGITQ